MVCKSMDDLINRFDVRLVSNDKVYLKWTSKQSYISQKYLKILKYCLDRLRLKNM